MSRFLHSVSRVIIADGNDVRGAPMVAEMFRKFLSDDRVFRLWGTTIESAGVRDDTVEEIHLDKKAAGVMKAKGVDISTHIARKITFDDILHSSIILTCRTENSEKVFKNILSEYPSLRNKVITLSDYLGLKETLPALLGESIYKYKQFVEQVEKMMPQLREKLIHDTLLPLLVTGQGLGSGMAQGKIRIIETSEQVKDIEKGDVVVCDTNHVDFLDRMYGVIGGIITDTHSESMHLSQVSDEKNIPCVNGASYATEVLRNGDKVLVDANSGSVYGNHGCYFMGLK
ncbi:PEP-utilizing enzyme [Chloroflexota bacterium]